MVISFFPRNFRSSARAVALAFSVAVTLAGCIRSQGPLLPLEQASTPLPDGLYFSISHLNSSADLPAVQGPVRVRVLDKGYVAAPPERGERPLRFHLIRLAEATGIFILQTDADDKRGYRDILIGVVGDYGFCSKDIQNFPPEAVRDHEIASRPVLLRWLTDHAPEIASMPNDVCFIRRT